MRDDLVSVFEEVPQTLPFRKWDITALMHGSVIEVKCRALSEQLRVEDASI